MLPRIAIGVAIAAFFVTVETMSSSSHNGVVTSCVYRNYGALILGAIAGFLGLVALITSLPGRRAEGILLGAAATALAVWHVLSGMGMIGAPCG